MFGHRRTTPVRPRRHTGSRRPWSSTTLEASGPQVLDRNWALDLPSGGAEHPSALVETPKARGIAVDAPVVTLSAAVTDALAASGRDSRALQVLTPATSRITHALRGVLSPLSPVG
ncbi:DUF6177 family protein [Nocardiopsis sp. B62]|uniref:DUF6177 family protein n=1 Tax=Nocardiopsis sp. B62 TaxID=2824874 RepID=UPI0035AF8ED1